MTFTPRLTAPGAGDKHWIHTSKGGKNSCILIKGDSVLPNCVGYAWGRFMEIMGSTPKLSRGNAENWWGAKDGYGRSGSPALGAVLCLAKGKVGDGSDGAGHVGIVEKIAANGTITVSMSAYGGTRWYLKEIKPPYTYGNYTFQGFILNPAVAAEQVPVDSVLYVVKSGDSLSKIAAKFGLTTAAIMTANPQIKDASKIYVSDVITIPLAVGDVDKSGKVDAADARQILRAALNKLTLSDAEKLLADINGDGKVDAADARLALKMALGKG